VIPLVVVGVALVVGGLLVVAGHILGSEPLDVERPEQWLVRHAPRRLRGFLQVLDRRFIGGVAVGVLFVTTFACALTVGWILSTVDAGGGIARWDEAAAEWGAQNATDASTRALRTVTDLGGTEYLLVIMVLLGTYHGVRRRDWGPLIYLATVGVGISLLNNGLKLLIDRERPDIAQLTGHAGSSFPSGHSAAAAACWAAIALVVARRATTGTRSIVSFAALAIGVGVAASRVLLGVHWVTDAVAGVLVGWTWFFVVTVVFGGRFLRLGEPADRMSDEEVAMAAGHDGSNALIEEPSEVATP
jgi:undecaprenyl-diphosphatase